MSKQDTQLAAVERIASDLVARRAVTIDRTGDFPDEAIKALGEAGLLGLISAESVGGGGQGLRAAARVVERLARECGSTAMVVCMHYCATAVLEQHGPESVRREIAAGRHLTTLAFTEAGSRSQFWAPLSTATAVDGGIRLDARKSWCTSAHAAQSYVWSSKPVAGAGVSTLWLVPAKSPGVRVSDRFDGLGLRGNDSCPVVAEDARIDAGARLGPDGGGFDIMLGIAMPWFNLLSAACSVGMMEAATQRTAAHVTGTGFEHTGTTIADLPTIRAYAARMRIKTDLGRAFLADCIGEIEGGGASAVLRVLESKAATGELATEVTDLAMRICGGAAFRREVGIERIFRDARASTVMAPTTDVLYDFIGKAVCNQPLFQENP
jgi:alkylation response protein AidB-like acyl-CoA dehydrogenase